MSSKDKHRLCWNCEASVAFDAEVCPYCGVSVVLPSLPGAAPYEPPYYDRKEINEVPQAPYPRSSQNPPSIASSTSNSKSFLISLIFMMTGIFFLMFGILLGVFASNSVLTLSWNGTTWWVYILLAIPLLGFGWRKVQKLEQEPKL